MPVVSEASTPRGVSSNRARFVADATAAFQVNLGAKKGEAYRVFFRATGLPENRVLAGPSASHLMETGIAKVWDWMRRGCNVYSPISWLALLRQFPAEAIAGRLPGTAGERLMLAETLTALSRRAGGAASARRQTFDVHEQETLAVAEFFGRCAGLQFLRSTERYANKGCKIRFSSSMGALPEGVDDETQAAIDLIDSRMDAASFRNNLDQIGAGTGGLTRAASWRPFESVILMTEAFEHPELRKIPLFDDSEITDPEFVPVPLSNHFLQLLRSEPNHGGSLWFDERLPFLHLLARSTIAQMMHRDHTRFWPMRCGFAVLPDSYLADALLDFRDANLADLTATFPGSDAVTLSREALLQKVKSMPGNDHQLIPRVVRSDEDWNVIDLRALRRLYQSLSSLAQPGSAGPLANLVADNFEAGCSV